MKEYLKKYKAQITAAVIAMVFGAGGGLSSDVLMDQPEGIRVTSPLALEAPEVIESPQELPGKIKGYIYQIDLIWVLKEDALPGLDRHYDTRIVKVIGEVPEKSIPRELKPRFPGYKVDKVIRTRKISTILKTPDRDRPG